MNDFLSRLAARSRSAPPTVVPDLPPRFAPEAGAVWSDPSLEGEAPPREAPSTFAGATPPSGLRAPWAPDETGEPVRVVALDDVPSSERAPPRHAFAVDASEPPPAPGGNDRGTELAAAPTPIAWTVTGETALSWDPFTPSMAPAAVGGLERTPVTTRSSAARQGDDAEVTKIVRGRTEGPDKADSVTSDGLFPDPRGGGGLNPLEALSEIEGGVDPLKASSSRMRPEYNQHAPSDATEPPEEVPLLAERPVRRVAARRAESPADDGEAAGRVDTPGELDAAPVIRVSIGRIEVRATTSRAPSPPRPRAVEPQRSTLDDYLRQRARGGAR